MLLLPSNFSISLHRSLDISSDEILANVQSANPTAYMLEWFISLPSQSRRHAAGEIGGGRTHFLSEFVTSVKTSVLSSSRSMMPRYPNRLSLNLGLATSFRHSI